MSKDNVLKYIVISCFAIGTIILLIFNICLSIDGFWSVTISEGIEIFILIFVSFFLVDRQKSVDKRKAKIIDVIIKIQEKILDPNLIVIDSENDKKVTRIKLKSISNLLEIITKSDISAQHNIQIIVNDMDSLSALVMDHIDDSDYIEKSNPEIVRLVTNIDTKLEEIKVNF